MNQPKAPVYFNHNYSFPFEWHAALIRIRNPSSLPLGHSVMSKHSSPSKKKEDKPTSVLLSPTITRPLAWGWEGAKKKTPKSTSTKLEVTAVVREFRVVSMLCKHKRTEYFCPAVSETAPFLPPKACLSFATWGPLLLLTSCPWTLALKMEEVRSVIATLPYLVSMYSKATLLKRW